MNAGLRMTTDCIGEARSRSSIRRLPMSSGTRCSFLYGGTDDWTNRRTPASSHKAISRSASSLTALAVLPLFCGVTPFAVEMTTSIPFTARAMDGSSVRSPVM